MSKQEVLDFINALPDDISWDDVLYALCAASNMKADLGDILAGRAYAHNEAGMLPPTPEEIEAARKELYEALTKTEDQPINEMRSADEVFAEARARLLENYRRRDASQL